ncbi:hypothetical protein Glove_499g16 [Diversispora epigaea]|uniref:Uncharacterized protein n=1 Tax=Diversispora epigaea TaxID=1348612 RepID=A0A397GLI0_9GLOM|nr:hypothetical protein Glove_499g16 [Diversispora epigaea]
MAKISLSKELSRHHILSHKTLLQCHMLPQCKHGKIGKTKSKNLLPNTSYKSIATLYDFNKAFNSQNISNDSKNNGRLRGLELIIFVLFEEGLFLSTLFHVDCADFSFVQCKTEIEFELESRGFPTTAPSYIGIILALVASSGIFLRLTKLGNQYKPTPKNGQLQTPNGQLQTPNGQLQTPNGKLQTVANANDTIIKMDGTVGDGQANTSDAIEVDDNHIQENTSDAIEVDDNHIRENTSDMNGAEKKADNTSDMNGAEEEAEENDISFLIRVFQGWSFVGMIVIFLYHSCRIIYWSGKGIDHQSLQLGLLAFRVLISYFVTYDIYFVNEHCLFYLKLRLKDFGKKND